MDRMLWRVILIGLLAFLFVPVNSTAGTDSDNCAKEGILVKNLTMLDLWHKKNNGDCTIWIHGHVFRIRPKDKVEIFSDLTCKTSYCESNAGYKEYKAADSNSDCRVRILPDCKLEDM